MMNPLKSSNPSKLAFGRALPTLFKYFRQNYFINEQQDNLEKIYKDFKEAESGSNYAKAKKLEKQFSYYVKPFFYIVRILNYYYQVNPTSKKELSSEQLARFKLQIKDILSYAKYIDEVNQENKLPDYPEDYHKAVFSFSQLLLTELRKNKKENNPCLFWKNLIVIVLDEYVKNRKAIVKAALEQSEQQAQAEEKLHQQQQLFAAPSFASIASTLESEQTYSEALAQYHQRNTLFASETSSITSIFTELQYQEIIELFKQRFPKIIIDNGQINEFLRLFNCDKNDFEKAKRIFTTVLASYQADVSYNYDTFRQLINGFKTISYFDLYHQQAMPHCSYNQFTQINTMVNRHGISKAKLQVLSQPKDIGHVFLSDEGDDEKSTTPAKTITSSQLIESLRKMTKAQINRLLQHTHSKPEYTPSVRLP